MINGKTQLLCLLGSPVEHSFSPAMHNAAFARLGINASYLAFNISGPQIETTLNGLKAMNFKGCNVTSPHKVQVMAYLDEVDEKAQLIGAVNTIVYEKGHLKGYNTDADGFIESLRQNEVALKGKSIAVLGTGGASKAIVVALLLEGAKVDVFSRQLEKAEGFCLSIDKSELKGKEYSMLSETAYDMVVNGTPMGMHPYEGVSPVDVANIGHETTVFYDLIYNPGETMFLKQARATGRPTINGLDMLIYQGIYALKYWFEERDIFTDWTKSDVLQVLKDNKICS